MATVANAPANGLTKPPREVRVVEDHAIALMDTGRFEHMWRIAKVMASATLIPEHLWKDKKGEFTLDQVTANCFLVVNQAFRWGFDPFAIAPETYVVGGKLGFQGKLVAALVNVRGGLDGRLKYTHDGVGDKRRVVVSGTMKGEAEPRTIELTVADARTDNQMWKKDPDQKLIYSGAIKWARRHCPEVILGVLTDDDLDRMREQDASTLPLPQSSYATRSDELAARIGASESATQSADSEPEAQQAPETVEPETTEPATVTTEPEREPGDEGEVLEPTVTEKPAAPASKPQDSVKTATAGELIHQAKNVVNKGQFGILKDKFARAKEANGLTNQEADQVALAIQQASDRLKAAGAFDK